MATAVALIAGSRGAFTGFRSALGQSGQGLDSVRRAVDAGGRAVEGVKRSLDQARPKVTEFTGAAGRAGRAADGLGRAAAVADPALRKVRSAGQAAGRQVRTVKGDAVRTAGDISRAGKGAATGNRLSRLFGGGLKLGSGAMKAINVAMKASPWGLVVGLLTPFIEQLITTALESKTGQKIMSVLFGLVEKYFAAYGRLVELYVKVLTGIVSAAWNGIRKFVQPALDWITKTVPGAFGKVKDAMTRTLGGIGDFMKSAAQTVLGVIKGPVSGIISFANMIIDGLNKISFSLFGKKFGVHLPRIPELAHGGIVPARKGGRPVLVAEAGEAEAVLPLSKLERLLARTAAHARAARGGARGRRIDHYQEAAHRGPYGTAEDLLFLARAGG
ncbi:hypothetical protein SMD11_3146 [Streptomyces albireticuli]|uniref:Tape-measure protein n=1 Tax=Streptomyces albireticuli TaxID=1940 RepID=A0A1Z2L3B2_9ACTN|nr:hypothetical protein [Streptomyces albireticuli]ARZ68789.1 hypothetical protein SMD11_3146 [Streptomyces albireticuli]